VIFASDFAIDEEQGLAYFSSGEGYDFSLSAFDLHTYCLTGYYRVALVDLPGDPSVGYGSGRMIRCGKAGIAVAVRGIAILPLSTLKPIEVTSPKPVPINGEVRRIPLQNNGLIYHSGARRFYASMPGTAGDIGNSIVELDPMAGSVGVPVHVGSEPWQMTVSDGGLYLYVALQGGTAVQRLSLPDLKPDLRFPLFSSDSSVYGPTPTEASQMLPVPGRPESVVVARALAPGSATPIGDGVAVYDNGIRRPVTTPGWSWGNDEGPVNVIQMSGSPTTLYGLDNEISDFKFFKLSMDADGVRVVSKAFQVGNGFGIDMKCENGLCFTNSGLIIDAEAMATRGFFQISDSSPDFLLGAAVAPDSNHGRVFYVVERQSGIYIYEYDATTHKKSRSFKIPGLTGSVFDLLIWNDDQLAFSTGAEIVLLPISLLQPL